MQHRSATRGRRARQNILVPSPLLVDLDPDGLPAVAPVIVLKQLVQIVLAREGDVVAVRVLVL